jgi:hypothetical protein
VKPFKGAVAIYDEGPSADDDLQAHKSRMAYMQARYTAIETALERILEILCEESRLNREITMRRSYGGRHAISREAVHRSSKGRFGGPSTKSENSGIEPARITMTLISIGRPSIAAARLFGRNPRGGYNEL